MARSDPQRDTVAAWRASHGIPESRPLAHPEEQRIAEREVQAMEASRQPQSQAPRRADLPTYTDAERAAMIADQAAWSRPASRAAMLGGSLWS